VKSVNKEMCELRVSTKRIRVALLLLLLTTGCRDSLDLAPVSGEVTLDGQPLPNAEVTFVPLVPGFEHYPESVGVTNNDGKYQLEVFGSGKIGAMVGKHRVEIRLGESDELTILDDASHYDRDALPRRYNDESQLEFVVEPISMNRADFQLDSE
jgi:hypothetical protein